METTAVNTVNTITAVPVVEIATVEGLKSHAYKRLIDGAALVVSGAALLGVKFGFDKLARASRPSPLTPAVPSPIPHK